MMTLEQVLRTAEVRRFHIVRLAVEQSVGEHVYCVMHIALALLARSGYKPSKWSAADLALAVAYHDIEEGLTGDIPSPTKKAARQMGFDWNYAVRQMVPGVPMSSSPEIDEFIKVADLLDAWRFVATYKVSPHGMVVRDRLLQACVDYGRGLQASGRWTGKVDWPTTIRYVMLDLMGTVKELTDADLFGTGLQPATA